MQPYTIHITHRAAAQIQRLSAWWQKNRSAAPDAVVVELERTFTLLTMNPKLGTLARNAKLSGVRRIHLATIHHHLYYRVRADAVDILALWHTSRGSAPPV
jgi:plasmid stabilization system protein ParE